MKLPREVKRSLLRHLTSRTSWGAVIFAAGEVAASMNKPDVATALHAIGAILAGTGLRSAVARNGKGA